MKHFTPPEALEPSASVERLQESLSKAARIVERHGARYLPIYLLIEEALDESRRNNDIMARVRKAAASL